MVLKTPFNSSHSMILNEQQSQKHALMWALGAFLSLILSSRRVWHHKPWGHRGWCLLEGHSGTAWYGCGELRLWKSFHDLSLFWNHQWFRVFLKIWVAFCLWPGCFKKLSSESHPLCWVGKNKQFLNCKEGENMVIYTCSTCLMQSLVIPVCAVLIRKF